MLHIGEMGMYLSRLSRLARLEEADLAEEGQLVTVRVQYAANGDDPPTWGPTYTYRMPPGRLVEEEDTPDET
jgi:hypothetical protein